ncbi:MAG: M48 family metalloprotease [Candidatus Aenigmarchaeota archaeon]|nr:M48 family metalloprotease [Candidatus Aenigmarchaeota archaeon]
MSTVVFVGTLAGLLLSLGWLLGGLDGLAGGAVLSILLLGSGRAYGQQALLKLTHARPLQDPRVERMLVKIAYEAKILVPRLYLAPMAIQNAFSTGSSEGNAGIIVSEGLLALPDDELAAVLAHEVAHIKHGDMAVYTLAAFLMAPLSRAAAWGHLQLNEDRRRNFLGILVMAPAAAVASFFVRMATEREREYRADWTGALLLRKPEAMASAVRMLTASARQRPVRGVPSTSHLWFVNPFPTSWLHSLFTAHPEAERRIERLEVLAPLG